MQGSFSTGNNIQLVDELPADREGVDMPVTVRVFDDTLDPRSGTQKMRTSSGGPTGIARYQTLGEIGRANVRGIGCGRMRSQAPSRSPGRRLAPNRRITQMGNRNGQHPGQSSRRPHLALAVPPQHGAAEDPRRAD